MRWQVTHLARRVILATATVGSCLYLALAYSLVFTNFGAEAYWDVRGIGGLAPIGLLLPLSLAWVFLLERLYPKAKAGLEVLHAEKFKELIAEVRNVLYSDRQSLGFVDVSLEDGEPHAIRLASLLVTGASDREITDYLARMRAAAIGKALSVESVTPVARKICSLREVARAIAL